MIKKNLSIHHIFKYLDLVQKKWFLKPIILSRFSMHEFPFNPKKSGQIVVVFKKNSHRL